MSNEYPLRVRTARLELVAGTLELANLEIENISRLAEALECPPPASWPPPLNDEHSQRWYLAMLKREPQSTGWALWYILRLGTGPRELIGSAGFKGPTAERRLRDWLQRAASTPWLRIRNGSCSCSRGMGIRPPRNRVRHGGNTSWPDCLDTRDGEMRHALRWRRQSRGRATDRPVRDYAKRITRAAMNSTFPTRSCSRCLACA